MTDKLKPCPFCGGEAEKQWGMMAIYWVECTDCGAEGSQHGSLEEAIAAWNTRNSMDRIVEQLEEQSYGFEGLEYIDLNTAIEIVKGGAE